MTKRDLLKEIANMARYLAVEMIFALIINQIKIFQGQILEINLFIRMILRVIDKHGKNFKVLDKFMNLGQNNIKYIN